MGRDWKSASNKHSSSGVPSWAITPPWGLTREEDFEMEQEDSSKRHFINRTLYTEDVLNRTSWVTGNGEVLEIAYMDKEHIRNVLQFLYKRKDKYWLNCRNAKLIEQFENGEDFFQRVIRVSTLWAELIRVLTDDGALDFNFDIIDK